MNPFTHMTSRLFSLFWGRKATKPAAVPTVSQTTGYPTHPPSTVAPGGNTSGSTHASRMANMAQQVFAPCTSETDTIGISYIDDPSSLQQRHKEWTQEGDELVMRKHKSLVLTCEGVVVPPSKLTGRCGVCGGFIAETPLPRCGSCSRVICCNHALTFTSPDSSTQMLCPVCFRAASDRFSSWQQYDSSREQKHQITKTRDESTEKLECWRTHE